MRYPLLGLLLFTSCTGVHSQKESEEITWNDPLPIAPKPDSPPQNRSSHVLYLIQSEKVENAIDALLEARKSDPYAFHEGTLQKLGVALLEQGLKSRDAQDLMTSLYGVGISQDERSLAMLERTLTYEDPQIQLLAVAIIASYDTDLSISLLTQAMKSNFLFVRLEAAYHLAVKRAPDAYGQLVALQAKLEPELHELFAHLYAIEGSQHAQRELKHLLFHQLEAVRREAILAIADTHQDLFLADIRTLSNEPSPVQQEACAYALGKFRDESARPELMRLSTSHNPAIALAAHFALYQLGSHGAKEYICQAAYMGNLFAIQLLGAIEGEDGLLLQLLEHEEVDVRINATLALLRRRDPHAASHIHEILIDTNKDYTYQQIVSHGGSMTAWRATSSSSELFSKQPQFFELSLRLREQALVASLELPEDAFIKIARTIFEHEQYDLIPLTIRLLENLQSEKALHLLREQEQRPGLPFLRAWSSLGLYRLRQEGHYGETVRKLVEKHEDIAVFKARPVLPWRMRLEDPRHELSLEQSCALLIESFEALAQRQDEKGIEMLLEIIRDGNVHNRYTLAGLLMRASL